MIKVELGRVNEKRELLLDGDEMIFTEGAIRIFKDSKLIGFFDIDDLINVYDDSHMKVYKDENGIHIKDAKLPHEPIENGVTYIENVKPDGITDSTNYIKAKVNVRPFAIFEKDDENE